jgi:predicted permease
MAVPRDEGDSAVRRVVLELDERLRSLSGVRAAGLVSTVPLSNNFWGTVFAIPGRPAEPSGRQLSASDQRVTPGYFSAMGIHLVGGRWLEPSDRAGAARVALINRHMAGRLWPGGGAVGATIVVDSLPWTIVGVVSDVWHGGMDEPLRFELYRPIEQAVSHSAAIVVWAAGDPARLGPDVRRLVSAIDPQAAASDVMTMEQLAARHYSPFRLIAGLVAVFAAVALVIAVVGLYGVIAYGVAQRTRELGIRMALGARGRDVARQVAGQAARLTLLGLVLGAVGALGFAQLLRVVLYGVTPTDPRAPLAVAAVLFGVAMAAALVPAWRAARLSPTVALREE